MSYRKTPFAPGEFYHILGRGNHKQEIFSKERDWIRFLFLILHFQSPYTFINIDRRVSHYVKSQAFNINQEVVGEITGGRFVGLVAFALMPNHFHLIMHESEEGGISRYMQRVMLSYTKYFNTKYNQIGHLFEGPFKSVHVQDDRQLLYLSAYIHRNPRELPRWRGREHLYPWSSFTDYVEGNRWGELLQNGIIASRFGQEEYKKLVDASGAKEYLLERGWGDAELG